MRALPTRKSVAQLEESKQLGKFLKNLGDVDFERRALSLESRKQRETPINPEVMRVLQERRKKIFLGVEAREFVFTRYGNRLQHIGTAEVRRDLVSIYARPPAFFGPRKNVGSHKSGTSA